MPSARQERWPGNTIVDMTKLCKLRYDCPALLPNGVGGWTKLREFMTHNYSIHKLPVAAGRWTLYWSNLRQEAVRFLRRRYKEQQMVLCAVWCLQQHPCLNKDVARLIGRIAWSQRQYKIFHSFYVLLVPLRLFLLSLRLCLKVLWPRKFVKTSWHSSQYDLR